MNFWQNIKKPIIGLAPMDGVTDYPMRKVQVEICKPDVMYTEFVSAEGFVRNPDHFSQTLSFEENQRPVVAQVFGYTPEAFYETILQIAQLDFDGIDINMGCPAKSVLGKGGGGALIENYNLSEKIINASLKAIKDSKKEIPLSVKTRIGKNENVTEDWISFLCRFSLAEVTIHGRLLKNGCSGIVNWEEIKKGADICHRYGIICLGNGGITSINEAYKAYEAYETNGVLIGQAALGNPWIFREDYSPSTEEILETILLHAKYVEEFYPPKKFVTVLKHFGWYPRNFKNCKQLKNELLKTKSYQEVEQVLAKFRKF